MNRTVRVASLVCLVASVWIMATP